MSPILTEREESIFMFIRKHPAASEIAIAQELDVDFETVDKALRRLKMLELIEIRVPKDCDLPLDYLFGPDADIYQVSRFFAKG